MSEELAASAEKAWLRYVTLAGIPRVPLTLEELVYVRSDPIDGSWTTAMAEVTLDGQLFRGFATARQPDSRLRWRAVNEAAERAVWVTGAAMGQAPDGRPAPRTVPIAGTVEEDAVPSGPVFGDDRRDRAELPPVESSSAGSAVHCSPVQAVVTAADEVTERVHFIERFHSRRMGRPVDIPAHLADGRDVEYRAWYDPAVGLLTAAAFGPTAAPKLAMAATTVRDQDLSSAVEHCMAEIVQSRAWIRRRQAQRSGSASATDVVDPGTRADYWSTIPAGVAHAIYRELIEFSEDGPELSKVRMEDLFLASAAGLDIGGELSCWYARVVAPRHVYRIHSASAEERCFGRHVTGRQFHPHPLI